MLQNYSYRARTATNQVVTGVVQAVSVEDARKILVKNQLTPLAIAIPKSLLEYIPFFGRISTKDITFFIRNLGTMITAGLTLSQSLELLVRQSKRGPFRSVQEAMLNDLQDGFSFSSSMAKFPLVFDHVLVSAIKSGETTGKLEDVLRQLSMTMEKDQKIKGKIKGAMSYPIFIIAAMIGAGVVMMTKIVPQLKDMFTQSGKQLPAQTQFLLDLSDFLVNKGYIVAIIAIAVFATGRWYLGTASGKRFSSTAALKLPLIKSIVEQNAMAHFGRLLSMLLSSGVPMVDALRMLRDSYNNVLYQDSVEVVIQDVERGIPMSTPLGKDKRIPLMVSQMVAVGEQTGKMDEVLLRMADFYESEVETKVSSISTLIEPAVILIIGVAVAWLVFAILMPVYSISSTVT